MAGDLPAGDGQRGSTPPGGGAPGAAQPKDQAGPGRQAHPQPQTYPDRRANAERQAQPQPRRAAQPRQRTEPSQSETRSEPQARSEREGSSQSPARPRPRPDQESPAPGLSGVDDDWDQEASLAASVAEVEAGRAHGLVDLDDLYYGEPWDSEVDLSALDPVGDEERAGAGSDPPLPQPDPPLPELDAGFLPRGRADGSSGVGRSGSGRSAPDPSGSGRSGASRSGAGSSAPSRSGEGRRSGFASGGVWDTALPGPALAGSADATAGASRGYAGTSDDELIGVLGAWQRIESWAAAGRLSAVAELIRRRPATRGERASRGGIPVSWGKFCADELAVALSISRWVAEKMTGLARDLATRLPLTNRALAEGVIDAYKAQVIAEATPPPGRQCRGGGGGLAGPGWGRREKPGTDPDTCRPRGPESRPGGGAAAPRAGPARCPGGVVA